MKKWFVCSKLFKGGRTSSICWDMAQVELVEKVKREYVGKWIGVKDGNVVLVSDTHEDLYRELKRKGVNGVYVFYSPTEEEKSYGFLF